MARQRNKENVGLPPRWRIANGAYYFLVPTGLEGKWDGKTQFRLGKSLSEAHRTWSARMDADFDGNHRKVGKKVGELLDRYLNEVVPEFSPQYKAFNVTTIKNLKEVFGNVLLDDVEPKDVYHYIDLQSKKKKDEKTNRRTGGPTVAKRKAEILSAAYSKAVKWGWIKSHPFLRQVEIEEEEPRDRYVSDEEFAAAISIEPRRKKGSVLAIRAYLIIKVMTGMSRGDLLTLREDVNIKADGIHIQRRKTRKKTRKKTHYEWTPALRLAVDFAREVRTAPSQFLFCNRRGEGYLNEEKGTSSGWDSMWDRYMTRVVEETGIDPFHDHDIRAKAASDAPTLEHARALLSHSDSRTTEKYYRRKPELVKPLSTLHLAGDKWSPNALKVQFNPPIGGDTNTTD